MSLVSGLNTTITRRVFFPLQFSVDESCMVVWVLRGSLFTQFLTMTICWRHRPISQGRAATRLRGVGIFKIILLQTYCWIRQRNNFENRLRFDGVTVMSLVADFFGTQCRPMLRHGGVDFWATVCKTVHPMLSDRCLSVCLRVHLARLVCCGKTAGWIKMSLGTEVGLGPSHIVLDRDRALPKVAQQPPLFGPCLLWPNGRPSQPLLISCF